MKIFFLFEFWAKDIRYYIIIIYNIICLIDWKLINLQKKQYLRKSKGKQKERVSDLLKLYKDGKIFNKISIQREVNRYLGQSFKNEQERELQYYKTMVKYLDVQPSTDKRREKTNAGTKRRYR